jgi:hypothetical protein
MRRAAALTFALLLLIVMPVPSGASAITMDCASPLSFPAKAIWCYTLVPEPRTEARGPNSWTDSFDTNLNFGVLNPSYLAFDQAGSQFQKQPFQHANHWMVDIVDLSAYHLSGGVLVSPDQKFSFENGKLVVEIDAAAGCGGDGPGTGACNGAGGADAFYEIDISPSRPTGVNVDPLYGYGQMGGVGALGCRLERSTDGGHTVCAMYDNTTHDTGGTDVGPLCNQPPNFDKSQCHNGLPGRVWETQGVGTARTAASVEGGYPGYAIPGTSLHGSDVFRICDSTLNPANSMPDTYCRDRFRFEFTKDSLTIYVNGYKWFDVQGLFAVNPATGVDNRIPDSFLAGSYVYFTSWVNSGQHEVTRWHWDRIAINDGSPLSAAPSYCLGLPFNTCAAPMPSVTPMPSMSMTPAPTPTGIPTATPTPTPTPSPSPTASPTPSPTPTLGDCRVSWKNGAGVVTVIEIRRTTLADCHF